MTTLTWILAASFAGGLLSIACAGAISLTLNPRWVPMLVSYAVSALLGAVFLDVLPQAQGARSKRSGFTRSPVR